MTEILVLGIGTRLWSDEGVGPAIVERLSCEPDWTDVEVLDGGTQGLYLLPLLQTARHLLVFDAVDFGAPPGAVRVLRDGEIPSHFGHRPLSLHQTAFTDVLAAAELTGQAPARVTLVGIQFERIEGWCEPMSEIVLAAIPQAIALGAQEIASWKARRT